MEPARYRPFVSIKDGVVDMDGKPARVVLRRDRIFVGCHDITPEAVEFILKQWKKEFETCDCVVLQAGVEE